MVETDGTFDFETDRSPESGIVPTAAHGSIRRVVDARIPTAHGEFRLYLYATPDDDKEHMALVHGDIRDQQDVLVRIHSECFTGDVLGSLRCDCGEQLEKSLHLIGQVGSGVLVYLRQEGRGIGLLDKLRAYNLQDQGYDTVDANLLLGHEPDERDYSVAALILADLDVRAVRLLTNNPLKIAALESAGIPVTGRIPLQTNAGPENMAYLRTKALRMDHLLDLAQTELPITGNGYEEAYDVRPLTSVHTERPFVTVSYAQSLDGCIAACPGKPLRLSGAESLKVTHRLRAAHDAILVGIGTVLADDPRLTVRLVEGRDPQPVVIDSQLRTPVESNLFQTGRRSPWLAATEPVDPERRARLEAAGARLLIVRSAPHGRVDLPDLLRRLLDLGIKSVMVEGGARVITSFLTERLIDQMVVTVVPQLVGGVRAFDGSATSDGADFPRLVNMRYEWLDGDMMLWGEPRWE